MALNYGRSLVALSTVILGATLGVSTFLDRGSASAAPPLSNVQSKALFEEKCSACHDLPDPESHGFTEAEWRSTVNRMLTEHNAATSISADQATQIVGYLAQFAPKPGSSKSYGIGVWQSDPVLSVSYPFTYPPTLTNFDAVGGTWRVAESPISYSGYLKSSAASATPTLLVEDKNEIDGAMDLITQFRTEKSSSSSTVGLVFGYRDDKNYLLADYSPVTHVISLIKITDGQAATLQQAPAEPEEGNTGGPAVWHTLRVKVTEQGSALEVLLDYQRIVRSALPVWIGGHFGLAFSGPGIADFRNLSVDEYLAGAPSPAGDIMLH
jgi:hypothetical protein